MLFKNINYNDNGSTDPVFTKPMCNKSQTPFTKKVKQRFSCGLEIGGKNVFFGLPYLFEPKN